MRACVRVCECVCVRVRVRMCGVVEVGLCVGMCVCVWECARACVHARVCLFVVRVGTLAFVFAVNHVNVHVFLFVSLAVAVSECVYFGWDYLCDCAWPSSSLFAVLNEFAVMRNPTCLHMRAG